jgi:U3 small nucleolar RNA-associated protein 24
MHSGTYADDCICERIRQHKCYIVATCDRDLRRRIRKAGLAWWHAVLCVMCVGCRGSYLGHGHAEHGLTKLVWVQVPGVPIMYIAQHKFTVERLPEATMGGAPRR